MPKMGNSVESCIIVGWKKAVGDVIAEGDTLCEVETDKAVMEVESTAAGTLLGLFYEVGDEVPVMVNIAAVGEPGEDFGELDPNFTTEAQRTTESTEKKESDSASAYSAVSAVEANAMAAAQAVPAVGEATAISPRARKLAERKGLETAALAGSGPGGRVIERDVEAALASMPRLTPVAKAMVSSGEFETPVAGSGPGGRVMSRDLLSKSASGVPEAPPAQTVTQQAASSKQPTDEVLSTPVRGIRAVIASRMLDSLQTTAQLTLNATADARAILAYRKRLKASPEALGLQRVTINDLILLAVSRTLTQYPEMNALYEDKMLHQYGHVHLGVAVDTPRGLMVPTVRYADTLTLRDLATKARRLAVACAESRITPDELTGGTFTVTNLGAFGVESFTPVLNPPQVGILGVGNINLKPIQTKGDEVEFVPHIGLSLTINHQVVDGAPAARFLQALANGIAGIELLLAV